MQSSTPATPSYIIKLTPYPSAKPLTMPSPVQATKMETLNDANPAKSRYFHGALTPFHLTTDKPKSERLFQAVYNAILNSEYGRLPLIDIYNYVGQNHPEVTETPTWKNSVRHKLSNDNRFTRLVVCANSYKGQWELTRSTTYKPLLTKMSLCYLLNPQADDFFPSSSISPQGER